MYEEYNGYSWWFLASKGLYNICLYNEFNRVLSGFFGFYGDELEGLEALCKIEETSKWDFDRFSRILRELKFYHYKLKPEESLDNFNSCVTVLTSIFEATLNFMCPDEEQLFNYYNLTQERAVALNINVFNMWYSEIKPIIDEIYSSNINKFFIIDEGFNIIPINKEFWDFVLGFEFKN